MSQMSRMEMKCTMNNSNVLTNAIKQLEAQFPGIRAEVDGKNIKVRYAGIEQYRHNGNLTFKWAGAKFEAVGDTYHTDGKLEDVIKAIGIAYNQVGVTMIAEQQGSVIKEHIPGGLRLRVNVRR